MFICRLPSNPALRKAWMDVIPEESRPISESSRICSKHFLESDFVYYKGGGGWLMATFHPYFVVQTYR